MQQCRIGKKGGTIFFLGLEVDLHMLIHLSTSSLSVLKRMVSTALLMSLVLFLLSEDETICMWYNHLSGMQALRGVAQSGV